MKKIAIFVIPVILILTASICFAAQLPEGSGIVYQVTLEAFSGGSNVSVSGNYSSNQVIGGINSLGLLSSPSFSMKVGIGEVLSGTLGIRLLSITPSSGYNIALVHIDSIQGINFAAGVDVHLTMNGQNDIVAKNINIKSPTEIACDFDIVGAKPGYWTLMASKDADYDTLPSAFEVKTYNYPISIVINYPNPFDPVVETTKVFYNLLSDTDVNVYIFSITADLIWKAYYPAGFNGGKAGENTFVWNGVSAFDNILSTGTYFVHVVERSSGKTLARGKIVIIRK